MRDKMDIFYAFDDAVRSYSPSVLSKDKDALKMARLFLEVLLDIRDALTKKN